MHKTFCMCIPVYVLHHFSFCSFFLQCKNIPVMYFYVNYIEVHDLVLHVLLHFPEVGSECYFALNQSVIVIYLNVVNSGES